MVTTTWKGGSGDWNTPSEWSNGVPTAADDAVLPVFGEATITGSGSAATLTLAGDPHYVTLLTLTGTHAVSTVDVTSGYLELAAPGALSFQSAVIGGGIGGGNLGIGGIDVSPGATLGSGAITLAGGTLTGVLGQFANPITLGAGPGLDAIYGTGTLSGLITGGAALVLGNLVLTNAANSNSGGIAASGTVEIATNGAAGTGPLSADGGRLILDAGVTGGPINAARGGSTAVSVADGSHTVFAGQGGLSFQNGSGTSLVVGAILPTTTIQSEEPVFGALSVTGGTGSVTVFGGNEGGAIFGGTAGGNVIVAGFGGTAGGNVIMAGASVGPSLAIEGAIPVTIGGGGNGDLLAVVGVQNNLVAAAGGNETLTGSGATGNNVFFGGIGADLIVAGSGQDLIVGGSGTATLVGGVGGTAIFAGAGRDLIVGGAGGDYIQAGSGDATVFAGAGSDLLAVVNGQAGGSVTVSGFRVGTDHLAARGYGSAPQQATAGGNTVLTFSDNTRVTLLGVASVPESAFT